MRLWKALAISAAAFAAAPPAKADVVCRPNTLGTVSCPGTLLRPLPRAAYPSVQAIDRVRARSGLREPAPGLVPARRTDGLGTILLDDRARSPFCRPDTLGNLNCR